ncbi:PTS sugar transporter subunit IIB [Allocoprobacillus halotolerans]|uniref:PTS sugar transporter subunit IIB n=1 Tax=Allocoprobacillus halotolerans TaxID=2944914 RepID=A0ABY5I4S5_9FIRM|nr:PTS sugar transporter subunit IIB [Allocoprobacillus halotolerans]UTY40358.1 PTS sugar transporter subunit IIB [Allocoprobacillus halotolerans]
MKILLVCSAGMSTSLLVERMLTAAKEKNLDVDIEARPIADTIVYGKDADAIMLGPQVRFQEDHIRSLFDESKPIAVIDMKDYGMMNGKKVLEEAMTLIESKK